MDTVNSLRQHLVNLLNGHETHITFEDAIRDYPFEITGKKEHKMPYTAWQVMEHMRIVQWDILNFSISADHVSPDYPDGYWSLADAPENNVEWNNCIASFKSDLEKMKDLVSNPDTDLFAKIPHGTGQTILREAHVLADHNSYHLGQLMVIKKFYC